jgi:hypothetical protein
MRPEDLVGDPMWYVFDTCVHLIRTLPALQHDIDNMEDFVMAEALLRMNDENFENRRKDNW